MMIYEYLKTKAAIGRNRAISTKEIMNRCHMGKRKVVKVVSKERATGALICSTTTKGGGYFLPASIDDIAKERDKMEKGIAYRAMALKPFRAFMKQQNARGAADEYKV